MGSKSTSGGRPWKLRGQRIPTARVRPAALGPSRSVRRSRRLPAVPGWCRPDGEGAGNGGGGALGKGAGKQPDSGKPLNGELRAVAPLPSRVLASCHSSFVTARKPELCFERNRGCNESISPGPGCLRCPECGSCSDLCLWAQSRCGSPCLIRYHTATSSNRSSMGTKGKGGHLEGLTFLQRAWECTCLQQGP